MDLSKLNILTITIYTSKKGQTQSDPCTVCTWTYQRWTPAQARLGPDCCLQDERKRSFLKPFPSSMKQTGYHGSSYLVTWESQPHHLSWEIKRVGPVDRPWPMAGAALLPGHGGFTSGLMMDFTIEGLRSRTMPSRLRISHVCHVKFFEMRVGWSECSHVCQW